MMFKYIKIIAAKELKAVFSDKRLVFTIFVLPFFSIILIYSVMALMMSSNIKDANAQHFKIALINTPDSFNEFIKAENISQKYNLRIKRLDEDNLNQGKQNLIDENIDYLISFEMDFADKINNYQSYTDKEKTIIQGYYYDKNNYANEVSTRMDKVIKDFKTYTLKARFNTESSYKPFDFSDEIIRFNDGKSSNNQYLAALIPMLLTTFIFTGAMSIGMDSFAGEKERGTMATMLMTTSPRQAIFIGKMLSLAIVAVISTISSLVSLIVTFELSALALKSAGEQLDLSYSLTPSDGFLLILLLFGLIAAFSAMIAITSLFAKNLKEANTYISPLYMLVILMGYSTMMSSAAPNKWQQYTPLLSNITNMRLIFLGQSEIGLSLYALASSLIICLILTVVASKMLKKEKYIF